MEHGFPLVGLLPEFDNNSKESILSDRRVFQAQIILIAVNGNIDIRYQGRMGLT
jgi:hypothetical protein